MKRKKSAAASPDSDHEADVGSDIYSDQASENDNHPLPSDRVLIDKLPELAFTRALVISSGRAQAANHLRQLQPDAKLTAWYIDLHQSERAKRTLPDDVEVVCTADLPTGEIDLAALAISMRGEAELTRELLQQSHERLSVGGTLAASVDNPRDSWLREQLEPMFDKVTCIDADNGRLYVARKTGPLKRVRNFQAEVVFRDDDRLIKLVTRPGVFAHRQLDPGARQLLLSVEIEPGQRVMDLGCGSGALAIAAALRADGVQAIAVDSNARAIDCTLQSAKLNNVQNLQAVLNSDGELSAQVGSLDVVLCNPPYYSDFEIAEKMIRTAAGVLRPGGAALFVNKQPRWYDGRMPQSFVDVEIFESAKYWVACGRKAG